MVVLGITGGIGAGKSRILEILREDYRAFVIQADEVAKRLEEPGQPGLAGLVAQFGSQILCADGSLDRECFAGMIFRDSAMLEQVNAIIHPLTWKAIQTELAAADAKLAAVEAALFDERSRELCEYLVFVDTEQERRIERIMKSRGYTREKCLDIMGSQPDRAAFLKLADFVIDNNGTQEEVRHQIAAMFHQIAERSAAGKITDKKDDTDEIS